MIILYLPVIGTVGLMMMSLIDKITSRQRLAK